jgi:DNA repair exonuclease SbcCD nuclease subunit
MKFLHCSDVHIDSPLRGLPRFEGVPAEEIRLAARGAFENLVALAVDEHVSVLIIAGDLYDGDRDDYNTALFLQRQFEQLREHDVPVIIAYGNHDAASEITRRLRLPANVQVFPHDHPDTIVLDSAGLALHGQSYATKAVTQDLSLAYPDALPDVLNVGVLHTCLDGRPGHEPYAPCRVDALVARGYAYWALGHVHKRDYIEKAGTWIVFPGNLQGRHARETGPKGAALVTYEVDEIAAVEPVVLDAVRWARCEVDVTGAADVDEVLAMACQAVAGQTGASGGHLTAVRIVLRGATEASGELVRERDRCEAQLRADLAGSSGEVWLEKVEFHTSPPQAATESADLSDALRYVRSVVATLSQDQTAREELTPAQQTRWRLHAPARAGDPRPHAGRTTGSAA